MAKASCNGISINYRSIGDAARDVVLVHGLAANHAFWHLDVLLPLAREYKVTVYDLRGHGHSDMPPDGYDPGTMAADLLGLMDQLGIARADLVGHSFGGVVALQLAALHPERVRSLTVADSRIRSLQPTQRPMDWPNWPVAQQKLEALGLSIPGDTPDSGLWLLEKLATPEWRARREKLTGSPLFIPFSRLTGGNHSAERWLELLQTTTARNDFSTAEGLSEQDLAGLKIPVMAVYGACSQTLPSLQGLCRCLPGCQSVTIPESGHFCPVTKPKVFVDIVRRFLMQFE